MLSVYDLSCNGLREPRGVNGVPRLAWRLGSDRAGARQAAFRVVCVSLDTGDVLWDSGDVASGVSACDLGGSLPAPGSICSWFVQVTDDAGEQAQSLPSAFFVGEAGDVATSELGPQLRGLVWTSSQEFDDACQKDAQDLGSAVWRDVLGVALVGAAGTHVVVAPQLPARLSFAQGSYLLDQGLLLVRCERADGGLLLDVSLPPGASGELVLGNRRKVVESGRSRLDFGLGGNPLTSNN